MNYQLLKTLENSRNYTLSVADAMPENQYQVKPADGVWSFGELMNHIAYGVEWWEDNYITGVKTAWNPPVMESSKKAATAYLTKAFNKLKETLNKQKPTVEAIMGFHATIDHITHHRGQATTYLRYAGIAPPDYVY